MTIEEKARAYDEALERAKRLYKDAITLQLEQDIKDYETIFPELAESEDEKIRKALINLFKVENFNGYVTLNGIDVDDVITWLEKHGEQKETPCDKCKKGLPSHSCQDITALGRCAIEKQGEQKSIFDFNANNWYVSKVDGKIHTIYHSEVEQKPQRIISAEAKEALYDKPKWSNDDEQYLLVCKNALRKYQVSDKWDADIISKWLEDKLKQGEQKPAWSEEDEKIALSIEHVMNCASLLNIVPEKVDKIRTWIKSLKQRMEGEE